MSSRNQRNQRNIHQPYNIENENNQILNQQILGNQNLNQQNLINLNTESYPRTDYSNMNSIELQNDLNRNDEITSSSVWYPEENRNRSLMDLIRFTNQMNQENIQSFPENQFPNYDEHNFVYEDLNYLPNEHFNNYQNMNYIPNNPQEYDMALQQNSPEIYNFPENQNFISGNVMPQPYDLEGYDSNNFHPNYDFNTYENNLNNQAFNRGSIGTEEREVNQNMISPLPLEESRKIDLLTSEKLWKNVFQNETSSDENEEMGITEQSPGDKFRNVSLAVMASKGPNTEDRKITRSMRGRQGGVIDLNQDKNYTGPSKYKIVNAVKNKNYKIERNPKVKKNAAKVIQLWWRTLQSKRQYENIEHERYTKIVIIQSNYRGYIFRKNMNTLMKNLYIYQELFDILKSIIIRKVREKVFQILKAIFNKYNKDSLKNKQSKAARIIYNIYSKKYLTNKKSSIKKVLDKWELFVKIEQEMNKNTFKTTEENTMISNKYLESEEMYEKMKNLTRLCDATKKFAKEIAFQPVKNKFRKYLKYLINNRKETILKKLNKNYDANYLAKYVLRWYRNTYNLKEKEKEELNLKNNQKKIILQSLLKNLKNSDDKKILSSIYNWKEKTLKSSYEEKEKLKSLKRFTINKEKNENFILKNVLNNWKNKNIIIESNNIITELKNKLINTQNDLNEKLKQFNDDKDKFNKLSICKNVFHIYDKYNDLAEKNEKIKSVLKWKYNSDFSKKFESLSSSANDKIEEVD